MKRLIESIGNTEKENFKMTKIRTLEIAFEKSIKKILEDFMSRIDYNNFDDSFDEGIYYFKSIAEQPINRAVSIVHTTGYKDANLLIKNRMRTAAVMDKTTMLLYITEKLTEKLSEVTENHKDEIAEKLVQHQFEQFTYNQIVDDLLTYFAYDTVATSRFARTATNYVYNQAHLHRYRDSGVVAGVEYAAHLDAVTSEICIMLDDTIWAIDDPNILTPPNHFNCLVAGTKIYTEGGNKNIENITCNDYVLTHLFNYMQVTNVMQQKSIDIYEISTDSCTIQITGDHPIFTRRKGLNQWINANQLHVYDFIITNRNESNAYIIEMIKSIKSVKPGIVYNISVDRDESYVANGIIVHNCRSRIIPYYGGIPGERDFTKDFEPEFIKEAELTLEVFKTKYWDL